MKKNSEGLVEISTIINYIPEEKMPEFTGTENEIAVQEFFWKKDFDLNRKYFKFFIKKTLFEFNKINFYTSLILLIEFKNIYIIFLKYLNFYNFEKNNTKKLELNNLKKYYIFMLNIKNKKPFINVTISNKTILAVSSGFVLKKLNIDDKKSKKHIKTLYLILKLVLNDLNKKLKKYKKIILQIRGTRKKLFSIIGFLKKKIKFNEIIFIYVPNFYQKSIKFKKIKAIKKKLKKKNIKR